MKKSANAVGFAVHIQKLAQNLKNLAHNWMWINTVTVEGSG